MHTSSAADLGDERQNSAFDGGSRPRAREPRLETGEVIVDARPERLGRD
jgi:hypothetical protein